jgi:hypothetical protein
MSGLRTHHPITLIRAGNGLDIDTHASELDCVLHLINNGALGKGIDPRAIGWGGPAHKAALDKVSEKLKAVREDIAEQDRREAQITGATP